MLWEREFFVGFCGYEGGLYVNLKNSICFVFFFECRFWVIVLISLLGYEVVKRRWNFFYDFGTKAILIWL